ncbi:MAG: hypothetical protein N2327_03035 [Caldimicrobium sp.]|nr:hypothetical protein [Caldimicrobium sp.]MCX7873397.1 hypothetical protein [Caldimicrobium sp.]MDW8094375.1 hypothetical protein [Caldimicrobium sp.]
MKEIEEERERMILKHDPWPGYRKIFWIVFILAIIYLFSIILLGYNPHR